MVSNIRHKARTFHKAQNFCSLQASEGAALLTFELGFVTFTPA